MGRIPVCPQHRCHPSDCFEIHYPESTRVGGAPSEEEIRLAILREHTERQRENIRRQQEAMSRSVVDARKKFNEARERNERDAV